MAKYEIISDTLYNSTSGEWSEYNKAFDVNYSTILSKLIFEAGRWCFSYASDLFVHWKHLEEALKSPDLVGGHLVFAFRETGVDNKRDAYYQLNNGTSMWYYRAIWCLDIKVVDHKHIAMELYTGRVVTDKEESL